MHVEDCADIIAEVVKNRKLIGIYNVKGGETYSVKELVQQFENHFGVVFEKSFSHRLPLGNIDNLDDNISSLRLVPLAQREVQVGVFSRISLALFIFGIGMSNRQAVLAVQLYRWICQGSISGKF